MIDDVKEKDSYENEDNLYELIFNTISNIYQSEKDNDTKNKIIRIITKIIENIVNAETKKENSEKFRRIKTSNPNISLMLDIKGNYEFIKYLGFEEQNSGENIYLYLPTKNINVPLFEKILSYIELLLLNFQEKEGSQNYYESNNNNKIDKDERPLTEAEKILRETGKERYNNSLKYSTTPNNNFMKFNNNYNSNIHSLNDYRQLIYKDLEKVDEKKACRDEIGKKCLQLTNNFRAKNKLPPLIWDDSIWRIAYTHSKNMGDKKVPFSHDGFYERVNLFPFYFSLACENVFMGYGYRDYAIGPAAVNGWINSPGHKKNLLSDTTHCAIATYITRRGEYYLTQMFARK